MTKLKTSELTGAALDYATGVAEGYEMNRGLGKKVYALIPEFGPIDYEPSTDWSQGGAVIEESHVELLAPCKNDPNWDACVFGVDGLLNGPTPLIAACRAIVAAKLGDEVDVPEELV